MKFYTLSATVLTLNLSSASFVGNNKEWLKFKTQFNKRYASSELESASFENFQKNLHEITQWNASGDKKFTKKLNQFSDMSNQQFREKMLMKNFTPNKVKLEDDDEADLPYPSQGEFECPYEYKTSENTPAVADLPAELDWRDPTKNPLNVVGVTPIKNQAGCGSCYAFSAISNMESRLCVTDQMNNCEAWNGLSEQQVLDCGSYIYEDEVNSWPENWKDDIPSNLTDAESFPEPRSEPWYNFLGCFSGFQSNVFQYVYSTGGISLEDTYDYKSGEPYTTPDVNFLNIGNCPYHDVTDSQLGKVYDSTYDFLKENTVAYIGNELCGTTSKRRNNQETHNKDVDNIKQALYDKGPLTLTFFVGDDFHKYGGGIYDPFTIYNNETGEYTSECSGQSINHAMNLVGYGSEDGTDYWIIRNSWSEDWGENGYSRVAMGHNYCNVESDLAWADMQTDYEKLKPVEPEPVTEAPVPDVPVTDASGAIVFGLSTIAVLLMN